MKLKKILPQAITLLVVIVIFGFFSLNAQINMANRGIDFGYGFLTQESSFDVQFSLIEYSGSDSYARAYLVGLLNTLLVSILGIIFCTIIGVVIGIARLSPNFLIRTTAAWYVEFFRNIPLLLQIFFWYYAALRALPLPQEAEPMLGSFFSYYKRFLYTFISVGKFRYFYLFNYRSNS
jgi:general L-amino acid transport system permease protein